MNRSNLLLNLTIFLSFGAIFCAERSATEGKRRAAALAAADNADLVDALLPEVKKLSADNTNNTLAVGTLPVGSLSVSELKKYLNLKSTLLRLADAITDDEVDNLKVLNAFNRGLRFENIAYINRFFDTKILKELLDDALVEKLVDHAKLRKTFKEAEFCKLFDCDPKNLKDFIDLDGLSRALANSFNGKKVTKKDFLKTVNVGAIKKKITQPEKLKDLIEVEKSAIALIDLLVKDDTKSDEAIKIINHALNYRNLLALLFECDQKNLDEIINFEHFSYLIDCLIDGKDIPEEQLVKIIKVDNFVKALDLDPKDVRIYINLDRFAKLLFDMAIGKRISKTDIYETFIIDEIESLLDAPDGLLDLMIERHFGNAPQEVEEQPSRLKYYMQGIGLASGITSLGLGVYWVTRNLGIIRLLGKISCLVLGSTIGYGASCTNFRDFSFSELVDKVSSCNDFVDNYAPLIINSVTAGGLLLYLTFVKINKANSIKANAVIAWLKQKALTCGGCRDSVKSAGPDFRGQTYSDFIKSLDEKQKASIAKIVLSQSMEHPEELLHYPKFISQLNGNQILLLTEFIEVIDKQKKFEKAQRALVETLTAQQKTQLKRLMRINSQISIFDFFESIKASLTDEQKTLLKELKALQVEGL